MRQRFALVASILFLIAMAVLDFTYDDRVKPDGEYPIANQNIEWYYAGKN